MHFTARTAGFRSIALAGTLFLVAACTAGGGGAVTPAASGPATASPSTVPISSPFPSAVPRSAAPGASALPTQPSGTISTAAQAAAQVIASDPLFRGVRPLLPDSVGLSRWYEAASDGSGYQVAITIGWGDCPAGCISRHVWTFGVMAAGSIGTPVESGDPLPPDATPLPATGDALMTVQLTAGPVCPVERVPPDPACAPRPVAGADVTISDPAGTAVRHLTSDASGTAAATLPSGTYVVTAGQSPTAMRTPEPVAVSLAGPDPVTLSLSYDTGIR